MGWAVLSGKVYSFLNNRKRKRKERERRGYHRNQKKITDPEKKSQILKKKSCLPTCPPPRSRDWEYGPTLKTETEMVYRGVGR
jgi:hypothetical protein